MNRRRFFGVCAAAGAGIAAASIALPGPVPDETPADLRAKWLELIRKDRLENSPMAQAILADPANKQKAADALAALDRYWEIIREQFAS